MKEKAFRTKLIFIILSFIGTGFIYYTFFAMLSYIREESTEEVSMTLSSGYDVTIDGTSYNNVDLSELRFDTVPSGTEITVTSEFPSKDLDNSMMELYTLHSRVRVLVENEIVYSYGFDKPVVFGYGNLHIPLHESYSGKKFTIQYFVMEGGEMSSIDAPVILFEARDHFRNAARVRLPFLMVNFALIIISLMFGAIALIFMFKTKEMIKLVFLAISVFGIGVWIFCSHDFIAVFSDNLLLRGHIEYMSFYTAPFFFTLYFFDDYFVKETSPRRYVYITMATIQGVFGAVSIPLNFLTPIHLPSLLPFSHITLILSLSFLAYMSIRAAKLKKNTHRPFLIGFTIVIGFALRDLILFVNYHYIRHSSGEKYQSRMLIGTFLFAICMFVDFFSLQNRRLAAEAEAEAFNKMAHTDIMTGLSNRRRCEEKFAVFAKSKSVFGIISFDLNDLKKTNDNYGHEAGDKLLTDFSNLLKSVFSEDCMVCRTGGDEFIATIPDAKKYRPENILRALAEKRDVINKSRTPLPLSYACGYCLSNDPALAKDLTGMELVTEVNKLSDARMYENKAAIKAARKASQKA